MGQDEVQVGICQNVIHLITKQLMLPRSADRRNHRLLLVVNVLQGAGHRLIRIAYGVRLRVRQLQSGLRAERFKMGSTGASQSHHQSN